MAMKYNTSLKSVARAHRSEPEHDFEESIVEPGESLPLELMIERMMNAGVARQVSQAMIRMTHYGPNEKIPDEFFDPTQRFNFNWAEAHAYKRYVEAKIRNNEEGKEEILKKVKERKDAASGPTNGDTEVTGETTVPDD